MIVSDMPEPKFCVSCLYCSTLHDSHVCMHPKARKYDLVTGHCGNSFASVMRSDNYSCSIHANWFTPIVEDADLDDLSTIPFGK